MRMQRFCDDYTLREIRGQCEVDMNNVNLKLIKKKSTTFRTFQALIRYSWKLVLLPFKSLVMR